MGLPQIDTGPMTVAEFYAFTDGRPDGEKWELIDGEAVLNASPSRLHQRILNNLLFALTLQEREQKADWEVIPGIGALVSNTSRPEPDAMILPTDDMRNAATTRDTDRASVLFEIISPSTADRDLKWKRTAYAQIDAMMHYVVIAQDTTEVIVFSRADDFSERRHVSITDVIALDPPGVTLALADIYHSIDI